MRKILAAVFFLIVAGGLVAGYLVFGPTVKNPDEKFLYVPTGSNINITKDSLEANGFLKSFVVFDRLASYMGLPANVKPGKYRIPSGTSAYKLVKKLREGRQETVNLVITKLRTPEELARRIDRNFELDSATAMEFLHSNDSLLQFDLDTNLVMTTVLPDTYTYFWTASMSTIFKKLYNEREKFWTEERLEKARRHGVTPDQVYIIASIVEEETNKQEDKGKIASVYFNRLRIGMPLAADPTIKFAMRDFGLTRIYHKHLDVVSPYNTYRNAGLPPGPICTPSRKTIDAVLDAPETNYLFFVAKPDFSGYSNFATTYNEHLIYARAYQKALDKLMKERQQQKADSTTNAN